MSNLVTETTTKEQMDAVYEKYPDTLPQGFQSFHESRVRPIFWDIPDNVSVLDIGTNSGEFMKRLIEGKKGIKVKGVDISEVAVKAAQAKGLDVVKGDGESLPFEDGSFDYVVLMEVIVHVHDVKKLLAEIKRVLKKDGVLIGSSPLKDLEMNIWDDNRLHHAYYTSDEIHAILKEFFFDVHFKILNGAQMNIAWAGSYIGDKPVEVLFKCGSENMQPWDYKLLDKDVLRVWMGPTQNAAVAKIRMTDYADKINSMERCDVLYDRFSFDESNPPGKWQEALRRTEENKPANMIILNQLEGLLKISDMSVWQITSSFSVLAFFRTLKHVWPGKAFVTEVDDWLFDIPATNIASHPYRPNSEFERVAYQQLELSDAVICSTKFICDALKSMFPSKPIHVVKNSMDLETWDSAAPLPLVKKKEGMLRIGYTGSGNHGADLARVEKPLLAILEEFQNVEFICTGGMRDGVLIKHERSYTTDNWTPFNKWPAAVKGWQMDIGIAPLVDSNFNRAKSNLRWLEYSTLSIPTVASKVYPFSNSIKHEEDGLVVSGSQAWYDALRSLILDSEKRSRIGQAARKRIEKDYSMSDVSKTYKSILESIKRSHK